MDVVGGETRELTLESTDEGADSSPEAADSPAAGPDGEASAADGRAGEASAADDQARAPPATDGPSGAPTYDDLCRAAGYNPHEVSVLVDGHPVPGDRPVAAERVELLRLVRGG